MARLKRSLTQNVDVVVTTPGIFLRCYEKKMIYMSGLHSLVIDEADVMLSKGFDEDVRDKIIKPAMNIKNTRDREVQVVFCLATYAKGIKSYLESEFPNIKMIATDNLHKAIPKVNHQFIHVTGGDKFLKLVELCKDAPKDRTIIFCNTIKSCQACDHYLNEQGLTCANYHSEMPPELKKKEFERFVSGFCPILVTTDIAARGLDISEVKRVIMADFPENAVDYIHRSGRTGRFGAKGKVISLLQKKDMTLAREIERSIKTGLNMEGISPDHIINEKIHSDNRKRKLEKKSSTLGKRKEFIKMKFDKYLKSHSIKPNMNPSSDKVKSLLNKKK